MPKYSLNSVKKSLDAAGGNAKEALKPFDSMDNFKAAVKDPVTALKANAAIQAEMSGNLISAGVTDPNKVHTDVVRAVGTPEQQAQLKAEQAAAQAQAQAQAQAAAAAAAEEAHKKATQSGYGVPGGQFDPTKYAANARTVDANAFSGLAPKTTLGGVADAQDSGVRANQIKLLEMLQNSAEGKGPSAAQAQLQAGTESNIRAALAQAASARGGGRAAAGRSAIANAGLANQQQAQQSAILRAQEMQAAQGLLGSTAQQARGQDQSLALANMQKNLQSAVEQGKISSNEAQNIYNTNATMAAKNAELGATYDTNQLQAALGARNQDLSYHSQNASTAMGLEDQAIKREQLRNEKTKGETGATTSGIGSMAALFSAMSDERAKTDIKDMTTGDIKEFLASVSPKFYRYKDEKHGEGTYPGYMAQDIERSKIGKTIVRETPDGKMIDMHAMQGAQLGVMKYLVDALEAKKGK